jgi:ABC-type transport system involved in multi-copper enzyme maturation permease subunit
VWKEVERRSVYSVLSKPVRRPALVVGKYLGLSLTLLVNVAVMAAALYAVLAYMNATFHPEVRKAWEAPALDPALLIAFLLILAQLLLMTAVALFFSTFSSPMLSAVFTFGLYAAGHFNADLKNFETIVSSRPVAWVARALYYVLPNLAPLDVKSQVVHGAPVAAGYVGLSLLYTLVYVILLLGAASLIFARRDLK